MMKFMMMVACVAATAADSSPEMFSSPVRLYFNALRTKHQQTTAALKEKVTLAATATAGPSYAPSSAPTTVHPTTAAMPTTTVYPTTTPALTYAPTEAPSTGVELLKSGFLNIIEGTATGCTPVTGVVRVALGVCFETKSASGTTIYAMNYVEIPTAATIVSTGAYVLWLQDQFSDDKCATPPLFNGNDLQMLFYRFGGGKLFGCGKLSLSAIALLTDESVYYTVTIDAGFDPVPAASMVPQSWGYTAMWADAGACAQPTIFSPPTLLVAKPIAANGHCPATVDCAATASTSPMASYGPVTSVGCSTVTPQTTGYFASLSWTGAPAECTGQIDRIDLMITLGECVPNDALSGLSPAGVTKGYYSFSAVSQTKPVIGGLQLTEYSDSKCTKAVATEIVFSNPWFGCWRGTYFGTYPASPTNPCFYLRQTGLISSTTGNPPLPLVPGTWQVASWYSSAAGCEDKTKKTAPTVCSASQYTDTTAKCPTYACFASQLPFGTEAGGTCLNVKMPPPTKAPTTKAPTVKPTTKATTKPTTKPTTKATTKPTTKGKVAAAAAAAEAVGTALGLRGAAAAATEATQA